MKEEEADAYDDDFDGPEQEVEAADKQEEVKAADKEEVEFEENHAMF